MSYGRQQLSQRTLQTPTRQKRSKNVNLYKGQVAFLEEVADEDEVSKLLRAHFDDPEIREKLRQKAEVIL